MYKCSQTEKHYVHVEFARSQTDYVSHIVLFTHCVNVHHVHCVKMRFHPLEVLKLPAQEHNFYRGVYSTCYMKTMSGKQCKTHLSELRIKNTPASQRCWIRSAYTTKKNNAVNCRSVIGPYSMRCN